MRLTYHDLVGSRVIAADGRSLGRVVDVVAWPVDDTTLRVVGLLVGYRALAQRIGRRGSRIGRTEIPWGQVAQIRGGRIRLSVPAARAGRGRDSGPAEDGGQGEGGGRGEGGGHGGGGPGEDGGQGEGGGQGQDGHGQEGARR